MIKTELKIEIEAQIEIEIRIEIDIEFGALELEFHRTLELADTKP